MTNEERIAFNEGYTEGKQDAYRLMALMLVVVVGLIIVAGLMGVSLCR